MMVLIIQPMECVTRRYRMGSCGNVVGLREEEDRGRKEKGAHKSE